MRPSGTLFRSRLCIQFLLLSAFLLHAPLAAAQEPPLPPPSQLTPDVRSRLAEAAQDSTLEPWQRDFMLGVARGNVEGGAAAPSPALSGPPAPVGIAADDGAWTVFPPPSARSQYTAIYDPVRDRMVVFGGSDGSYRNDVWALSLAGSPAWSALAPAGSLPPARRGHTAFYDPVRDRMVVFGGSGGNSNRNDVWALSWDQTTPTLLARFEAEVTSAGVRLRWQFGEPDRIVSEALERAANQVGPWMPLTLVSHRTADATEALDATVAAGETYYYRLTANLSDGTRATFGPISAVAILAVKVSGLTGIAPNPASASARIDFALVREERVRISVVDIAGRETTILADGQMAPGSYSMLWDAHQGSTRLPAGVYFVRWTSTGKTMNRKLVLVQ